MQLPFFLDNEPPPWHTWAILAAGLAAALLTLWTGRFVLAQWRRRVRPTADAPEYDPFEQGSVSERRAASRRKGNPVEVLITDADAALEPVRGWVINRSIGGLCLLMSEELAPGTLLSVKPRQGPFGTPWVQAEVRCCNKDRSGYQVGCEFLRTPPWAVLLLFG